MMTNFSTYQPLDATEISKACDLAGTFKTVKQRSGRGIEYYNAPMAFDIETTSFTVQSNGMLEKRAVMYIWTLAINGIVVQGRTWSEFISTCKYLVHRYELTPSKRIIIYVHNLSFEFQFMHKWFEWSEVFSLEERQPIKAVTTEGIEFRCSYKLSRYSLENLGKNLTKYKIKKLVGELDYSLKRNAQTVLDENEIAYCVNDVLVVSAYIQEYIDRVGRICDIPLTCTGEVRNFTRKHCFYGNESPKKSQDTYKEYRQLMEQLTMTADDYVLIRKAFAGGFTHANALWANTVVNNVYSMDFTSSYPYVMLSEKFPMSSPISIKISNERQFKYCLTHYCCVFTVKFVNIRAKLFFENYISYSHCKNITQYVLNNGRLVSAKTAVITITEQDFKIINSFYAWDEMYIGDFKYMYKGYLPTNFVKAILELYNKKTVLKDVEGAEAEYLLSKERINACYGMTVTDICRDNIIYSPSEWQKQKPNIDEAMIKNNNSKKRFLYYPWGVWVTAYARVNLFTAILELGDDYIYSDTDSVKFINYDKHISYFENYNKRVLEKLSNAMRFHKIDIKLCSPKNRKGIVKTIGVWDYEGCYEKFKTLGAKRYLTYKDCKYKLTVAGLGKVKAMKYLEEKYGDDVFSAFTDGLFVPSEWTGKLTHTYIDNEFSGIMTDYQGNSMEYHEKSAIHLGPAEYSLSMDRLYIDYILGIKDMETV